MARKGKLDPATVTKTARLDELGIYRYDLTRTWDPALKVAVFVMLNPSTVDASEDDATIRRCVGFARSWGYGGIRVVNLFALRATNPRELLEHPNPYGIGNQAAIQDAVMDPTTGVVVCAWGMPGKLHSCGKLVEAEMRLLGIPLHYLAINQDGSPGHPLYLRSHVLPTPWKHGDRPSKQAPLTKPRST